MKCNVKKNSQRRWSAAQEKRKRGMKHGNSRRCATTTSCESKVEFCSSAHLRQRSFSCCFHDGCYVIWRVQLSGFSLLFTPACRSGRARKKSSPTPTVTSCSLRRAQHHCMCVSVCVCVSELREQYLFLFYYLISHFGRCSVNGSSI